MGLRDARTPEGFMPHDRILATDMGESKFPELATERLELCEITRDHAGWYLRHFSTPEIVSGQGFPAPKDLEAAKAELDEYMVGLFEKGGGFRWGIRLKGKEDLIGTVGFYAWDKEAAKAKMGYDLQTEHWGRGLMREALDRAIRFGFEEMGLNRVEVTVMSTNPRSMALVGRLGFKKEGVLRDYSVWDGQYVDEHVFALLKGDWSGGPQDAPDVRNPGKGL